jgi:NodT family efflux transporter outer membrane factor (OMF) lipoprotein
MDTTMKKLRVFVALCPAVASLALTGCMVGPKYHAPAAVPTTAQAPPVSYKESPTQFPPAPGWKVAQPQDAMLHGKWWEIYGDAELNALEDQLNINNQNIKQFFENYMEARALIAEARSQLYPTLGTQPSYQRSRSSANLGNAIGTTGTTGPGQGQAETGQQTSIASLPLEASWTPDLWGKVRNTIREEQYGAQLSEADLENERLTEQASLATFFFEIRGQDSLIKLFQDTVDADKKALDLTQAQYETGVGDRISVVEAQNTLQNAQAGLTNLGVARAQFEHAIAVLIGTVASHFSIPVRPLDAQPPPVPIGLPSQLLERRPDIAAAERNIAAANAQIGIAYAAYYPNVTLTAQAGYESAVWGKLLDWSSRFWSVGGSVDETIFDAGLRRATVHQFVATYNADVAAYRQTVLTAFQQVEDSLASERILSQQTLQQQQAANSAAEFVRLEMGRYETGIDPYVNVVTAQTTLLTDQQAVASLQTQQMTSSVSLIEALGGGWDLSQLPTPAQVSVKPSKADTTIKQ